MNPAPPLSEGFPRCAVVGVDAVCHRRASSFVRSPIQRGESAFLVLVDVCGAALIVELPVVVVEPEVVGQGIPGRGEGLHPLAVLGASQTLCVNVR